MASQRDVQDGFLDLVLGGACVGCAQPGRALCARCQAALPTAAALCWPTPTPPGLVPPFATGPYGDVLKAMVVAHKERRLLPLAAPLGHLLAQSVRAAVEAAAVSPVSRVNPASPVPLLLVPVPSRPSVVRHRGHDATATITRLAARRLTDSGRPSVVAPLLRVRPGLVDQAGLDSRQRAANLTGALAVRNGVLRRRTPAGAVHVLLCDDVITTGASLREAQRALESVGIRVLAAATVAATQRQRAPRALPPDASPRRDRP